MKVFPMIDDSNVEKADKFMSDHFKKNAEQFFEREIRHNLKDQKIFSDESIKFLDKIIKEKALPGDDDKKLYFIIFIGSYLGQYVITKFQGNWVVDRSNCSSPLDFFVRFTMEDDLYFRPFSSIRKRIDLAKKDPVESEIKIIKMRIKEAKALYAELLSYFINAKKSEHKRRY